MADPWTGRPGEPVPVALRHTPRVTYTEAPGGIAIWTCAGCEASAFVPVGEEPEKMNVSLCPVAVAQRIAELEAHEASLHKNAAWVRGEIVRWLRRDLDRLWTDAQDKGLTDGRVLFLNGRREALAGAASAIELGNDARWCEAHPVSPAPADDKGR